MKCAACKKEFLHGNEGAWCTSCYKVKYCCDDCEEKDAANHTTICRVVQELRTVPGFNHRLFLKNGDTAMMPSHQVYQTLHQFGSKYLKHVRGAVCYTTHRLEKLPEVEKKLKDTTTTASYLVDPLHQLIVHYFMIPMNVLKKMCKNIPRNRQLFIDLCRRDDLAQLGVPVVYFREIWVDGEQDIKLATFLVSQNEF